MTPRERVCAALEHREPDRVPLDIGGTESSGMTGMAYNRLKKHLKLAGGRTQIFDTYQQIARIEDDVRRLLEVDTVPLLLEPRTWKPFRLGDASACEIPEKWNPVERDGDLVVLGDGGEPVARMPRGGFYFEPVNPPLAHVERPSDLNAFETEIAAYDWPSFADEGLDSIEARAKRLHRETDYAVVANLQLHLLAAGQILRGYENFMVDLVANKELAHALLERLVEAYTERCEAYFERVAGLVQVVLLNDDLGTQMGPMLSPDCYSEMIFPYQRRLFQFVKRRSGAAILFHSCGSVHRFIPQLIEAGVDALNPVQVSAAGMDTARLKQEFGRDITFWGGGCDTQRVLNRGTPEQIRAEVETRIGDLARGGGFVFTQVHNIQPDVPAKNVMAMIEAFRESRDYGR